MVRNAYEKAKGKRGDGPCVDDTGDPAEDPEKDVNPEVYEKPVSSASCYIVRVRRVLPTVNPRSK